MGRRQGLVEWRARSSFRNLESVTRRKHFTDRSLIDEPYKGFVLYSEKGGIFPSVGWFYEGSLRPVD